MPTPIRTSLRRNSLFRTSLASAAVAGLAVAGTALSTTSALAGGPKPEPVVVRLGSHLLVLGSFDSDTIGVRLAAGDPARIEFDLDGDGDGDRRVKLAGVTQLRVLTGGGEDDVTVDDTNGVVADRVGIVVHSGSGNDRIGADGGAQSLDGGSGNDTISGGTGADTIDLGRGADRFEWAVGDDDDVVDGGYGVDAAVVSGGAGVDRFEFATADGRVRLTRAADAAALDLGGIERADLTLREGADSVTVGDLAGSGLTQIKADIDDADADLLTMFGTAGDDDVAVAGAGGSASVTGLAASLVVAGAQPTDVVQVLGLAGADRIDGSGLSEDAIGYGASGHEGDDVLIGGAARDSLNGGAGNDLVDGRSADDSMFTGPGDDTIPWRPGEGSDIVGGQDGADTLLFDGSAVDELFVVAGDGFGGAVLTRDVGNIVMSLDRVERIELRAGAGGDRVLVDDLSDFRGTGLEEVRADLGPADGAVDKVTVTGSDADDAIVVTAAGAAAEVIGLPSQIRLTSLEATDVLTVRARDGADTIDATALLRGVVGLIVKAGAGDDNVAGGPGDDVLDGGPGEDVLDGNGGDDVLRGGEHVEDD